MIIDYYLNSHNSITLTAHQSSLVLYHRVCHDLVVPEKTADRNRIPKRHKSQALHRCLPRMPVILQHGELRRQNEGHGAAPREAVFEVAPVVGHWPLVEDWGAEDVFAGWFRAPGQLVKAGFLEGLD